MNLKKMLSVMAATAIGVTSLSLVSVSAKSIDNAQVGTIYKAEELGGTGSLPDFFNPNQETAYNSIGAPFGEYSELTDNYTKMITESEFKKADNTYSLTYNIETGGNYTFYVLTPEYNGRYTDIYLNDKKIFNGHVDTSVATEAGNMTVIDNDGSEKTRQYGIIHVTKELSTGTNKFEFKMNEDDRFTGIVAVALIKNAEPEVEQSKDWTNLSGALTNTTVVDNEKEGGYIFTYPQGTKGSGFSYNLLDVMTNQPEDLSAVTTGKIKVSYDLYLSDTTAAADDFFIDLSGNQTIRGWGGGNAATYGRLSGYGTYNDIKFIPGQLATNSGDIYNQNIRVKDQYVTVTYTVDLADGTFTGAYGDTTSTAMEGTATEKTNALYLNVQPSLSANSNNDIVMKIKNISAEYIADASEPVVEEGVKFVTKSEEEGSDYAYGYTYTKQLKDNTGYTGCEWTITYGDSQSTNTEGSFATKVSGEGAVIVTGLIITTGQTKAAQPDINAENPTFEITAQLKAAE